MNQRLTSTLPALVAFGIGVLFGWFVLGWWLVPVQWTDAAPVDLASGYRQDYLALVADSYAANQRVDLARRRLEGFGPAQVVTDLEGLALALEAQGQTAQAQRLRRLADQVRRPDFGLPLAQPTPAPTRPSSPIGLPGWLTNLRPGGWLLQLLVGLLGALLIGGGIWLVMRFMRQARVASSAPAAEATTATRVQNLQARRGQSQPGATQHVTLGSTTRIRYERGQQEVTDLRIVDGTRKLIGQVELRESQIRRLPNMPPAALELRLFDRLEPRTRIGCLVSREALLDPTMRQLIDRESDDMVKPPWDASRIDQVHYLETRNLQLEARVVDAEFDDGDLYPTFNLLVLEVTPTATDPGQEPLDEDEDDLLDEGDDDDDQNTLMRGDVLPSRRPPGM